MSGCPHPELTTYLRWLIWDQHALSPGDGVFYVLGMAVPFHPDQVAGRRNLPCKDKETKPRHCLVMQAQVQGSRIFQPRGTPRLVAEVYHSTCASQPLKHLFPWFQLPDKGYIDFLKLTLDACEQTWTWISQDPKLNKPKHQLNGSSRQLFQQVTGFLQQLKAFSSPTPKVYMKPIPSGLNS